MYCNTEKASASLLSSPNALINELRAKRLGFKPSALMTLNAFSACSDKPCQTFTWKIKKMLNHHTHDKTIQFIIRDPNRKIKR